MYQMSMPGRYVYVYVYVLFERVCLGGFLEGKNEKLKPYSQVSPTLVLKNLGGRGIPSSD